MHKDSFKYVRQHMTNFFLIFFSLHMYKFSWQKYCMSSTTPQHKKIKTITNTANINTTYDKPITPRCYSLLTFCIIIKYFSN